MDKNKIKLMIGGREIKDLKEQELTWVGIKSDDILVLIKHLKENGKFVLPKGKSCFSICLNCGIYTGLNTFEPTYSIYELMNFVEYFPSFGIRIKEMENQTIIYMEDK